MPITKELKNVRNFETVGFSHEQAESLADAIEESHADSHENLKEFIRSEFDKQNKDFDNKLGTQINDLDNKISNLEVNMVNSQKELSQQISNLEVNMATSQKELSQQISNLEVNMATSQKELSQQISNLEVNMATSQKELSQQTSNLEVNMAISQKDLLVKIFAIIVGTVGVAITIIKLF